jgi:hypothetical protein
MDSQRNADNAGKPASARRFPRRASFRLADSGARDSIYVQADIRT